MDKLKRFFTAHREAAVYVLLIILAFMLLSVQSARVVNQSKGFGYSVVSVFQLGVSRIGSFFSDTFNSIAELRKLRTEYDELRTKINEYQHIERDILDLQRENERLRTLLGFSEELSRPHIAARIVAKDANALFGGLTIDKGEQDGIREEQAVIAYSEGFQGLVGRVVEIGEHTAKILPIIDRSSYVAARMRNNRNEGLVRGGGTGTGSAFMEFVKKRAKEEIGFGDLVITSGLNSIYPKGIYIGRVRSFEAPEWEPSLTLEIETIVDFSSLEYVFVLKGEEEES
ncbi:MAG: rod shape-determining protein MreC [Spirochaetia bacterium]